MYTYRFRSRPLPPRPPPTSPPPTPPRFINYSGVVVWAGWSKGTREERSEGTVGVLLLSTAARCLPGSLGLTGGYVPYQDPVYSQPKRLPGTHFHKAAWSPVRKLIPLCRRCTAMLSARLGSARLRSALRPLCILRLAFLSFVSICFPLHLIFRSFLVCHISPSFFPSNVLFFDQSTAKV